MPKRQAEEPPLRDQAKALKGEFSKQEISSFLNKKIFEETFQDSLQKDIASSTPYKWGTVTELMDDSLLRDVRTEVLNEIAFTKKETDIYKVYQSGDLANLSGLDWDDLSRLPSLYKLRAAIYSEQFRDFISRVTGCGKLSGSKTDMSINAYTKGCHLLTHDDVIGSRRVSFILYMPSPDALWKPHYGGALRLFPSVVPNVPKTDYEAKLTPQFNQIAFFTVQPGLSFHDVEEVHVDKQRLSIQGWFHIPQEGEPGYVPGEQEETESRSTLSLLQTKELQEFDFPKQSRIHFPKHERQFYESLHTGASETELWLTPEDIAYLGKFLNPVYLARDTVLQLRSIFLEESVVEITEFLNDEYSNLLKSTIRSQELDHKAPALAQDISFPWKCAVPPHKQRYMYIDGTGEFGLDEASINRVNHVAPQECPNFELARRASKEAGDKMLLELCSFMRSISFKKWLSLVTEFVPTSDQILARRFRPGQDFILATTTEKDLARDDELDLLLEGTLGLTPTAALPTNWESGEYGGYELCMAMESGSGDGDFEDDDPAIYRASDQAEDSVLFTSQCKWNSLTLLLRDPSVLKFVKYVSFNAKGSRWDISGQWNVKSPE